MLERLKAFSPYAWMPVLIVGVISATLAYRNLSLQEAGNRPDISLGMQNVGTHAAFDNIKTVGVDSSRVAILALCATFHDDDEEQLSDPMFDPNADVCCLILAESSDHRGKILQVVCHKPSPRWRSADITNR